MVFFLFIKKIEIQRFLIDIKKFLIYISNIKINIIEKIKLS